LKRFDVPLTRDAAGDLGQLYDYVAEHDAPSKADYVLDRIQKVIDTLATFPERGSYPKELLAVGIREYRQTFFKPYRVIYRINGQHVYLYLIADGRRDMQALLERRLLGA
jgi:toxin ParE1/3/4